VAPDLACVCEPDRGVRVIAPEWRLERSALLLPAAPDEPYPGSSWAKETLEEHLHGVVCVVAQAGSRAAQAPNI
jgi:hypothetical protein